MPQLGGPHRTRRPGLQLPRTGCGHRCRTRRISKGQATGRGGTQQGRSRGGPYASARRSAPDTSARPPTSENGLRPPLPDAEDLEGTGNGPRGDTTGTITWGAVCLSSAVRTGHVGQASNFRERAAATAAGRGGSRRDRQRAAGGHNRDDHVGGRMPQLGGPHRTRRPGLQLPRTGCGHRCRTRRISKGQATGRGGTQQGRSRGGPYASARRSAPDTSARPPTSENGLRPPLPDAEDLEGTGNGPRGDTTGTITWGAVCLSSAVRTGHVGQASNFRERAAATAAVTSQQANLRCRFF
ncbi:PREDICTED: uncharacterized protein LOC105117513, partial [Populus euphratica]|uniref:Uncharacterized protein LOC105117513 n=1 Tax=Populus euphratica TaxID=75702 RepID=A0AAJ6TM79_POPEU